MNDALPVVDSGTFATLDTELQAQAVTVAALLLNTGAYRGTPADALTDATRIVLVAALPVLHTPGGLTMSRTHMFVVEVPTTDERPDAREKLAAIVARVCHYGLGIDHRVFHADVTSVAHMPRGRMIDVRVYDVAGSDGYAILDDGNEPPGYQPVVVRVPDLDTVRRLAPTEHVGTLQPGDLVMVDAYPGTTFTVKRFHAAGSLVDLDGLPHPICVPVEQARRLEPRS